MIKRDMGGWRLVSLFFRYSSLHSIFVCCICGSFFCFRSMYIRFYFTFLTLRWIDDEDCLGADTVDVEFTITLLLQRMCSMREAVS